MKTDNELKREPGFYWVNHLGVWLIALYSKRGEWILPGEHPKDRDDNSFEAIHETRLLPPDQPGSASNSTSS